VTEGRVVKVVCVDHYSAMPARVRGSWYSPAGEPMPTIKYRKVLVRSEIGSKKPCECMFEWVVWSQLTERLQDLSFGWRSCSYVPWGGGWGGATA
jgi:hypothetical protein